MFEKLVDARYLHEHPEKVDNFWDYHLVQLVKLGYADVAAKFDPDWNTKVAKFKQPTKGRVSNATEMEQTHSS